MLNDGDAGMAAFLVCPNARGRSAWASSSATGAALRAGAGVIRGLLDLEYGPRRGVIGGAEAADDARVHDAQALRPDVVEAQPPSQVLDHAHVGYPNFSAIAAREQVSRHRYKG